MIGKEKYNEKDRHKYIIDKCNFINVKKILDVGCGTGARITNELADNNFIVCGIDIDKSSIEKDLGAFSEMVIENIKKTMKQAKQAVMNEVVDDSQHSSELENSGVMSGSEGIPAKVLPVNKDSMDGLFDKLKIRTEIDEGRILIDPSKVEEFKHKN